MDIIQLQSAKPETWCTYTHLVVEIMENYANAADISNQQKREGPKDK